MILEGHHVDTEPSVQEVHEVHQVEPAKESERKEPENSSIEDRRSSLEIMEED